MGSVYSTTLSATGGTGTRTWGVIGALPTGLTLNPSAGVISGTPTTAGTYSFTIQVQDSGTTQQSDQRQFNLTINPVGGGGGGGTLTVSNAPASVGGTFVVDPASTIVNPPAQFNIAVVGWSEAVVVPFSHFETMAMGFDITNNVPQASAVVFGSFDNPVATFWICSDFLNACNITVNRTAGTVTFNNSVLTDLATGSPPITLNGTLNFTPF